MNINSYMPCEIISGRDCLLKNGDKLKDIGNRCLIVTGGSSAVKSGALKDAEEVLLAKGIVYTIFNEITENPYTVDCHRAGKIARETGADFILGIGGGSPLDASKAIAIYAADESLSPSDIYLRKYNGTPLPVVLVGTTSGTGSEVTGVAVLTNSDNGMKKSISGHDCYSVISFCDYKYTCTMPYSVTVSTALDAFAHATESFFSSISNDLSELYAKKAIKMLWQNLLWLCDNKNTLPDEKQREELYEASLFAGLALNITGTCFPHTVGYILTEDFGITHGRACTAFTSELVKLASENSPQRVQELCDLVKSDVSSIVNTIDNLTDVHISMTEEQYASYCKRWTDPVKNFVRTPGNITSSDVLEMLRKYLG